jgi:hypothetical protein
LQFPRSGGRYRSAGAKLWRKAAAKGGTGVNWRIAPAGWLALVVLLPALALSLPASLAADVFTFDAYAIDTGSSATTGNSCSRLSASIGQTATGFSSGGGFDLSSGFQAIVATSPGDAIFFDGFEGCKP